MVPYGKTRYSYKIDSSSYLPSTDKYELRRHYSLQMECIPGFQKENNFLWPIYYKMVSLFALLFLNGYGSTRCNVCSQHNGMI